MKTVLYHDHEDGIIAYTMNRTFHFEQFSENDTIMTINFVYVVSVDQYCLVYNVMYFVDCIKLY